MRFSIIVLLSFLSLSLYASDQKALDDKAMKDLFTKYDQIMQEHKVELVEEVFTKKFLTDNGGKEEFISKVKELPKVKKKKGLRKLLQKWKKSKTGKIFFADVKEDDKKPDAPSHQSQFIVVEEEGKLKIDGTMSDGN